FRIFDAQGKVVVDTEEKRLTQQARHLEDLRKQRASLWTAPELTGSEKEQVIGAVTSIAGPTLMSRRQLIALAVLATLLVEAIVGGAIYGLMRLAPDGGRFVVAALLPLTGDLAFFGGPEREVLLMETERVNREGGIRGRPIRLEIEDSKSSAREGV